MPRERFLIPEFSQVWKHKILDLFIGEFVQVYKSPSFHKGYLWRELGNDDNIEYILQEYKLISNDPELYEPTGRYIKIYQIDHLHVGNDVWTNKEFLSIHMTC